MGWYSPVGDMRVGPGTGLPSMGTEIKGCPVGAQGCDLVQGCPLGALRSRPK